MTDLITARSLAFIEQNANRPFFIDVAYNAPHWPYQPPHMPSEAANNARHVLPHDAASTRADSVASTIASARRLRSVERSSSISPCRKWFMWTLIQLRMCSVSRGNCTRRR